MKSYIYKDDNDFNTNMYKLMQEFKLKDLNYKWLITDIETTKDELFNKDYIIINHKDLIRLLENNKDIQWIWAVFSAIPSKYSNNEIFKYNLPSITDDKSINNNIKHPLAEIEIDCIDSSYAKIIFKDKGETYEKKY
ncbi:MAG TPA: hypothetical protein IAB59_05745 [Candidatus Onthousia faecipullorum]|uniref:Uncharacterized protein n=1 Tax=Candidatus Onthousia faecipullorum TaxID=2840887 RepID=A0A9D1KBT4_9FIRM|nr:hypothetical protein [Candidatus Onthousia faecipullorum]